MLDNPQAQDTTNFQQQLSASVHMKRLFILDLPEQHTNYQQYRYTLHPSCQLELAATRK